VAELGEHLPSGVHRLERVVARLRPHAARVADFAVQRDHGLVVDHPRRIGQLERVPQLVPQHRHSDVGVGIQFESDANVAVAAGGGEQLGGGRGLTRELAAAHVDDQIGRVEPIDDGAKGRRLVAPASERGRQPRVLGAEKRRFPFGVCRRRAGEEHEQQW